jgi:hypothetical protein
MSRTRMATSSASAAARPQANNRLHVVASEQVAKIVHCGERFLNNREEATRQGWPQVFGRNP